MHFKRIKLEPAINWKAATCQRITSKKHSNSVCRYLNPRYGQAILVRGYTVLKAVSWSKHECIRTISGRRLPNMLESVRLKIGMPVGWTDRRSDGRCKVTWLPNFLGWVDCLSYGAPLKIQNWARDQIKYQWKTKKYATSVGRKMTPRYSQVMMVSGCSTLTAVN